MPVLSVPSLREQMNNILVKHTGQSLKKVEKDTDRDRWMSAEDDARRLDAIALRIPDCELHAGRGYALVADRMTVGGEVHLDVGLGEHVGQHGRGGVNDRVARAVSHRTGGCGQKD